MNESRFIDNGEGAFGIRNIVETGLIYNKKPGEWYGPLLMIQIFKQLNTKYKPFPLLDIITFLEGAIYINQIFNKTDPMIVFVGFRLGLKKINREYFEGIFRIMRIEGFIGISGGQEDGALYFVGYQNDKLIFLDPHVTQQSINSIEELWTDHLSYHYPTPLLLPIEKMNTCFAIGFYLRTRNDCERFVKDMKAEAKREDSFIQIYDKEFTYDIKSRPEEIVKIEGTNDIFVIL